MRHPLLALLLCASLASCGSLVVNPVTGETERTVMDEADEISEGAKAHEQVIREQGVHDNPALQAYVNEIGQRLAAQSHRANLKWTFTVLDSPEVNAFALPGGYIYVTRGILAHLDSEAELAGVIGHEIGHVTARHGAQHATRQQTAGLGVLAATVLGAVLESQGMRGATDMVGQASRNAAAGYVASYSREQESQADQLGAEYLARNQYDPRNMIDVIALLKNQESLARETALAQGLQPPASGGWLSSHPSNAKRLADIRQTASLYQGRYVDDGRERYLKAIDGITFGEGAYQGVTRGRRFFHEVLGIALTAPEGWRIRNGTDTVSVLNASGDAGLVLRLLPPDLATTPEGAIRKLLKADQNQLEGRFRPLSLNGLPATHFQGVVRTPQGQSSAARLTVAQGPKGNLYLMRHAARDAAALQRAAAATQEAEASFRAMTAADSAAARPWRLRIAPLPKGGFAELARTSPLATDAPSLALVEAQLKLLNSAYGDSSAGAPNEASAGPRPGQLVKVVE